MPHISRFLRAKKDKKNTKKHPKKRVPKKATKKTPYASFTGENEIQRREENLKSENGKRITHEALVAQRRDRPFSHNRRSVCQGLNTDGPRHGTGLNAASVCGQANGPRNKAYKHRFRRRRTELRSKLRGYTEAPHRGDGWVNGLWWWGYKAS